jgi:hypothetical protein
LAFHQTPERKQNQPWHERERERESVHLANPTSVALTSTKTITYTLTRRTSFAFPFPEITMQAIDIDPSALTSTITITYTLTRRTSFAFPFPEITMQAIDIDPSAPEAVACQYMLADPNLSDYSDTREEQRNTLFYATNGDGWAVKVPTGTSSAPAIASVIKQALSFLSYSVNECDWMLLLPRKNLR